MSLDLTFPGDEPVAAGAVTPETVKHYFEVVKNVVRVAKGIVALTRTPDDDKVIEKAEAALALVEPYLDTPWVYDILNMVVNLFRKEGPAVAIDALKSAVFAVAGK